MHDKTDRETMSRRRTLTQVFLGCVLLLGMGLAPFGSALASCGFIPGTFPVSTGSQLDVKNGVTMNGNPVPKGKTGANSVLQTDGTRATVGQTLPDIVPSAFPANNSNTNATEADSPFVASSAVFFDKIKVNNNQTATFSGGGPFHINKLEVKDGGTLNLGAGTYFINELILQDNVTVNITSEPVILHIGKKFDAGKDATVNPGGSVTGLQVMLHKDAKFKANDRLNFTGLIYGPTAKEVKIDKNSTVHGAIITGGKVKINDGTTLTYTPADQAAVNSLSTCSLIAYYQMDEPPWAAAGEVLDSSGNANHADPVPLPPNVTTASATPAIPTDSVGLGTCGYGVFPQNTTTGAIDAVDTTLVPGDEGALSFWYHRTAAWGTNGASMIVDASIDNGNNGADKYFFLVMRNNGRLRFRIESSNDKDIRVDTPNQAALLFPAATWVHLAITWNLSDKTAAVYINGQRFTQTSVQGIDKTMGTTSSVYLGDNRTTGVGGGGYTGRSAAGLIDEVRIYNGDIDQTQVDADRAATHLCALGLDHYAIVHDGTGVTCDAEPVSIEAHKPDDSVFTGAAGTTVTLTTSTGKGDWTAAAGALGVLTDATPDDGQATYTFAAGDNGVAPLLLKDTNVETVNIGATDGTASEKTPAEDPDLVFDETGFIFLADTVKDNIGTQIAGKSSDAGFGAQIVELQAVRTSNDTGACEAALTGPVSVELGFECRDPAACGASQVTVNGTVIAGNSASPPPPANFSAVNLDFGNALDTTATLVLNYPDAGSIQLHARYDIPLANGNPSGNLMVGASNAFVVRPFGLDIDFSNDRQTNGTAGISFAADANGSVFTKAGQSFSTTVTAMQWAPGQDVAPLDGVPDSGVSLAGNSPTPRFGQEMSPATVDLTHVLVAPATANTGTLGGGAGVGGFTSGAVTVPLTFDEVGIIDLNALHTNYLGAGFDIAGTVSNVGRFIPARLVVAPNAPDFRNGPDAAWTCTFTYMDQPFSFVPGSEPRFTVQAQNLGGAAVLNYGGDGTAEDFWKFNAAPFLPGRGYADNSGNATRFDPPTTMNGALGSVALTGAADFADGQGTLTVSGDLFTYMRDITPPAAAPIAPFEADASLTVPAADLVDTDGVCFDNANPSCNITPPDSDAGLSVTIASIKPATTPVPNIRFGRMGVQNTFGAEVVAQTVPLITQFFDGAGFVTNTDDACTALQLIPHINLGNPATGVGLPGDTVMTVLPAGTTSVTSGDPAWVAGQAGLVFSAPGAGNTGFVNIAADLGAAAMTWLQYDWDGDGVHDNDPSGRASFGVYQGPKQIIYEREPAPF